MNDTKPKLTRKVKRGMEWIAGTPEWADIFSEVMPALTKKEQSDVLAARRWVEYTAGRETT